MRGTLVREWFCTRCKTPFETDNPDPDCPHCDSGWVLRAGNERHELELQEQIAAEIIESQRQEEKRLKAENERLRNVLDKAIDLLCGTPSGHVVGSQADCQWQEHKNKILNDYRNLKSTG